MGSWAQASGHPNQLGFQSVSATSGGSRCLEGRTMFGGVPAGSLIGPRSRPGVGSLARGLLHAAVPPGAGGAMGRGKGFHETKRKEGSGGLSRKVV